MITKRMIQDGIKANLVEFVPDPNMVDGTVCKIGSSWFYFDGLTAAEMPPTEFLAMVPIEAIVNEIFDILEEFKVDDCYRDEYNYYEAVLTYRNDQ